MKTEILVTLLFAAAASTIFDATLADDDTGMCPLDYIKKHPKAYKEILDLYKKYGWPNFNKLVNCSAGGSCEGNLKCCQTLSGLRCMKPLYENNAMETLEEVFKNIGQGPLKEPYEMTEEDKKYGMCPETFLRTHPEVKEDMKKQFTPKKNNPNEKCTQENCQRHKGKQHHHFCNVTKLADCSVDGDCADNRRCCNTLCGKKCVKPVFTKEDFMNSISGDKNKPREKRELESNNEENPDRGYERGVECSGHDKGEKCQGREGENGKCQGRGVEHGKSEGKGGERGKSKGKGSKCGKGKSKGQEHGNEQRKGDENSPVYGQRLGDKFQVGLQ